MWSGIGEAHRDSRLVDASIAAHMERKGRVAKCKRRIEDGDAEFIEDLLCVADSTGLIRCDGWTDWPGMCPAWSSEVESNRQSSDGRQDIQVQPSTPRPRRRSRALVLGWRRQVGFPNRLFGHLRVLPAAETSRPIAPVASGRMPSQQVAHDLLQFTLVVKRSFMTCLLTSRLQKAIYDLLGSQFRHNR